MGKSALSQEREMPLRFVYPDCYRMLLKELSIHHLHPYDVKADAMRSDGSLTIMLRYGEGLRRERKQAFSENDVERLERSVADFFHETAEDCKQTLIQDYYKLMKP